MENAVLCQKGINYAFSSWKTVDQMFIGKEDRAKKFTNSVVLLRAFNINSLICGHSKGL